MSKTRLLMCFLLIMLASCDIARPTTPLVAADQPTTSTPLVASNQPAAAPQVAPPCEATTSLDPAANRWTAIGPYGGSIRAVVINPVHPETVYVATFGAGIYRSDDKGDTWRSVSNGLTSTHLTSLAIDAASPQTLYAGTGPPNTHLAYVFRSDDGGGSWAQLAGPDDHLEWLFNEVTSLAVSPQGLYMGSQAVYTYSESDWELVSEGFLGNGFISVVLDPGDQAVLYAGTYQGGLFRSDDDGVTWHSIAWDTFEGVGSVRIAVDPTDSSHLLARGRDVLLESLDRGATWKYVLGDDVSVIAFDPLDSNRVWAGGRRALYVSSNGGASWVGVAEFDGVRVTALAIDPISPGTVFVGTHSKGLFRSHDGGLSWEAVNTGIANTLVSVVAADPSSPDRLYVGTLGDGLFVTKNMGGTWSHIGSDLTGAYVKALLVHPTRPQNVFAGTWEGLFISHDAGQTWATAQEPLARKPIVSLAASYTTDDIYAGTYGDGLFVSRDVGANWVALEGPDRYVTALVADPTDPRVIYAGTLTGVYSSNDGGMNWEEASVGIRDLNVQAMSLGGAPGSLYVATGDGIYASYDYGSNWERRSAALGLDYFRAVIGPEPLLAASWNGVFLSEPGILGWTTLNQGFLTHLVTSLARTGDMFIAGTYGAGAYVFMPECWPLWGRVTDSSSGEPLIARIVLEPGTHVTFTDGDGRYAFDHLQPGRYQLTILPGNEYTGWTFDVEMESGGPYQFDVTVPVGMGQHSMPFALFVGKLLFSELGLPRTIRVDAFLSGETLPLTLHLPTFETLPTGAIVIWSSDLDGVIGSTSLDDRGTARIDVRLREIGHHTITADVVIGGATSTKATTGVDVQGPGNLSAIGMAWDGEFLWVGHEPASTGELGRIYQLAALEDHLTVVNSYVHPSPAPGAIAWDGTTIWIGGPEGPDPFKSWDPGTDVLSRHSIGPGLPVIERYVPIDDATHVIEGLTWDGEHLWGSSGSAGARIVRYRLTVEGRAAAERYAAPGSQMRTIEWVDGHLWAFDSQSNRLFKLDIDGDLSVEGSCEPGMIGSYAMAWDGAGFWMWSLVEWSPRIRHFELRSDCPQP